jgi:hypothetical protein
MIYLKGFYEIVDDGVDFANFDEKGYYAFGRRQEGAYELL